MKNKKLLSIILVLALVIGIVPLAGFADESSVAKSNNIVVLYTGNLTGSVQDNIGIDGLVAYTNEKKDTNNYVGVIDSGNNTKGTIMADKTAGNLVVESMNVAGYSVSVPGKAELSDGVAQFLNLAKVANFPYVSANLYKWNGITKERVLSPYKIVAYDNVKVAYLGITDFAAIGVYDSTYSISAAASDIQEAIDSAYNDGATYVVALGNLDENEAKNLIKGLSGLNCFINSQDKAVVGDKVVDKSSKNVIFTSTGARMENVGVMTIYAGTLISTQLLSNYNAKNIQARDTIKNTIDSEIALQNAVGTTQHTLNAVTSIGVRTVESAETNLGDLVADAVKIMSGAEIALIPATEFQTSILVGDISYADIIDALPYNKYVSVVEMKGSDLMDALEMAAINYPKAYENFFQVSGITYDISETTKSSVSVDTFGNFVTVNDEYRVTNVKVNGADLSLFKTYKVVTTNDILSGKSGFTMFGKATKVRENATLVSSALVDYLTYAFKGNVPSYYQASQKRIDSYMTMKRSELEAMANEMAEEKIMAYMAQINNLKADMSELSEIYALTTMQVTAQSSFFIEGGKRKIKVSWKTSEPIEGLSYQVYRSTSKNSGYSKMFTTKNMQYTNSSKIYKGNTYYYKVRAYKTIKGKTYYSEWSNIAYRKVNK